MLLLLNRKEIMNLVQNRKLPCIIVNLPLTAKVVLHYKQGIMTINEFRSYPNCSDYSDEDAQEIISTVEKLAVILFDFTCQQYGIVIDNQLDIGKSSEETLNQAA